MVHVLTRRRALLASAACMAAPAAFAQANWPNRPIKMIVPGPPGGAMDNLLRIIQLPLQEALKQSMVMDFKPGANSIIGMDAVAKAQPDGYTFLITPSSAVAINPIILEKMPFDAQKDLAPVAQFGTGGILLVANPAANFKNLQDMVKYAQANPGKLSYGSWGNGSTGHLVMEGIKKQFGVSISHIPYKTTAQEITDLIAGTLPVGFTDIASPLPHIKAGKLTALGVSGSIRAPALPNLPTLSEQGFKFESDGWFGIFAPAGTPAEIVNRMNEEIGKILAREDIKQKFAAQNMTLPAYKTAAQFAATVKSDSSAWQQMAKGANLKMD
ncbi:Bug family tripartite tricarboxylate transporter substrate binding protein [Ottowia thiooxydans]|uniref:Bug family tripartite tricarboxylate transporter substrate binding protein n=1 Tax=Ottowia thiooxydans TaxID=219182 RepID=UPI0003F5C582|nr:tripartite tricarboxylate transporter substrate binding protein [Ottowia thiooxydans]